MAIDTTRLLSEVEKSITKIQTTIENKILSGVKENNPTNSDENAIKNLKKNITPSSGITGTSTKNIPSDIYTAFATMINNDLAGSKIKKFSTNDIERTNQILEALESGIKNKKNTIDLNGIVYTIDYNIVSYAGMGESSANVRWRDKNKKKQHIILTWTNVGNKQGTKAIAEYCSLLKDLDLELWKDFFQKVLKSNAKTWIITNCGEKILKSITDKIYAEKFLKTLGLDSKDIKAANFGQFISDNLVDGDVIVSSAKLLKTLEKKQTALITAVNNNKKIESKLKDFAKTCNQLETKLGLENSDFSIGEFTVLNITNKKSSILITGNSGNDTVSNFGKKVTIKAGVGNDLITNNSTGINVKIFGENGNDSIRNYGYKVTISGGTGNDSIGNSGGDEVTISGGTGNDSIGNYYGTNATISGGSGNDSIENYDGENVTISGGSGNDSIYNWYGNYVKIFGYNGNDSIENYYGDNVTISGGNGNDSIENYDGDNVTISGGNGNDSIENYYGKNVTISGGSGNDKICNWYGNYVKIFGENENDSILNYGYKVTISGGSGNDSIDNSGDEVTISGGTGNDSIVNSGDEVTISGGSGNDSIGNYYRENVTISGGTGNDSIYNWYGNYVKIFGDNGNDSIKNDDGDNVTISGGNGNDSIENYYGKNVTISGGTGNDKISISSSSDNNVIQYASGDGKDTIYGFNSDDTLQITKGNYKVSTKNNDVIVKVGSGSITLKDANGQKISIKNSKGKVTTKTYGLATSALLAENDFIMTDNLSSIMKNNLMPTSLEKISETNFEKLTQENNWITFADK